MASATNDPGGSSKESSLRVIQKGADDFFDSLDEVSDVINCSLCRFTCSRTLDFERHVEGHFAGSNINKKDPPALTENDISEISCCLCKFKTPSDEAFRVHVEGHCAVPQQREPICGAQSLAEPCRTYSTGTVKVITLSKAGSPAQPRGNPGQHGGIPVIGTPRLPNVRGNLKKKRDSSLTNKNNNWAPVGAPTEFSKVTPSLAKVREASTVSLPKVVVHRLETEPKQRVALIGPNSSAGGQDLTDVDTSIEETASDSSLVVRPSGLNEKRVNRKLWTRDGGGKKSENGLSECTKDRHVEVTLKRLPKEVLAFHQQQSQKTGPEQGGGKTSVRQVSSDDTLVKHTTKRSAPDSLVLEGKEPSPKRNKVASQQTLDEKKTESVISESSEGSSPTTDGSNSNATLEESLDLKSESNPASLEQPLKSSMPDRRHSEIAANSSKQNIDISIKDQPQISAEICTKSTNKRGRPKKSRNSIDIGELTQAKSLPKVLLQKLTTREIQVHHAISPTMDKPPMERNGPPAGETHETPKSTLRPSHSKFVSPLTTKMADPAASLELLKDIQSRCWSRKGMKDLEIDKLRIDNFSQAEGTSSQLWLSTFLVDQSVGVGLCKGCEGVFKLDMRGKKSSWSWTTKMKQHANQNCPLKPPQRLPLQEIATNEEFGKGPAIKP